MADKFKNKKSSFHSEIKTKKESWDLAGHIVPEDFSDTDYTLENETKQTVSHKQVKEILSRINNKFHVNSGSNVISEKEEYLGKIKTIFLELLANDKKTNIFINTRNVFLFALVLFIPAKGIINYVHKIAISKA